MPRGGIGGGAPFDAAAAAAAAEGPVDVERPKRGLPESSVGGLPAPPRALAGWDSCCLSGEADGVLGGAGAACDCTTRDTADDADSDASVPVAERYRLQNVQTLCEKSDGAKTELKNQKVII